MLSPMPAAFVRRDDLGKSVNAILICYVPNTMTVDIVVLIEDC